MFDDLLHLPRRSLALSTFTLEDDAIVRPSAYLEDLDALTLRDGARGAPPRRRAVRAGGRRRWPIDGASAPGSSPARWPLAATPAGPADGRAAAADRLRGDRARSLSVSARSSTSPATCSVSRRTSSTRPGLSARARGTLVHAGVPGVLRRVGARPATAPSTPRRCRRRGRCSPTSSIALPARRFRRPSGRSSAPCCSARRSAAGLGERAFRFEAARPQPLVARELEVSSTASTRSAADARRSGCAAPPIASTCSATARCG